MAQRRPSMMGKGVLAPQRTCLQQSGPHPTCTGAPVLPASHAPGTRSWHFLVPWVGGIMGLVLASES